MTVKRTVFALIALACLAAGACGTDDDLGAGSTTTLGSDDTVSPAAEGIAAAQTFTKADSGSEGRLAVGEDVVVALEACIGCGYDWQITANTDPTVAESLGSTNEPRPSDSQPGDPPVAGGTSDELFRFRGLAAGTTTVTIGYFPPAIDEPEETFTLTLVVT